MKIEAFRDHYLLVGIYNQKIDFMIGHQSSVYLQQLVVASAEVLEKNQIFQKCAKYTLTLMSNYEIDFLL